MEADRMSFPKNDRKVRSKSGNSFPASEDTTARLFAPAIALALKIEFGGGPSAIKMVARITGANERAARNWFEAKNGPSGENLMALLQHSDAVLKVVLELSKRDNLRVASGFLRLRAQLTGLIAAIDKAEAAH